MAGSQSARRRAAFHVDSLPVLESLEIRVSFRWRSAGPVTLDAAGLPRFPVLPGAPGLYRFDFGPDELGVRTFYIGESKSLRRRASNYRNAKSDRSRQRTSRRIHKEIVDHLGAGGTIEFAIACEVSAGEDREADLRLKSARRLAENAAVLVAQIEPGTRVLNIDAELDDEESEAEDAPPSEEVVPDNG